MFKKRVNEVVFVIRNKDTKEIAGINTVYISESAEIQGRYYFYRIFIHPRHRCSVRMIELVSYQTFLFLMDYKGDDPKPEGMAMVMENPMFFSKGVRSWLLNMGLTYWGDDHLREIWYIPFSSRPAYWLA